MQKVNSKIISKRRPMRKLMNTDDSVSEDSNKYSNGLLKGLHSEDSILLRRQIQTGFSFKPINTKLKKYKSSPISIKKLIEEMKAKMSNFEGENMNSHCNSDLDYIFVNPSNSSPHKRSEKEININSFLNSLGIFQININVTLNEYNF